MATAVASAPSAVAQSVFSGTGTQWGTASNWSTGEVPDAVGAQVLFNSPSSGYQSISSYGKGRTIGVMTVNNTSGYELSFTSTSSLTFSNGSEDAQLNIIGTTSTVTRITSPIILSSNLTLNVTNTNSEDNRGALSLSGVVSGTGRVTKIGAGTASIAGSTSTFTGGLSILEGTIRVTGSSGVGADPGSFVADYLTINGGRLQYDGSGTALSSNIGVYLGENNGEIAVTGSGTYTIGGVTSGTGRLTKTGAGTLYLNPDSANTYSGGTLITEGTLQVGRTGSLGTGAVQLGVDGGGAVSLISNRAGWTYANDITVTSGTGTRTIGNNADTGNFNTNYSGDIAVNGDLTVQSLSADGYALRFSGALSGTGDITKTGAGIWRLEDSANTWTGSLFVEEGGFVLDADARFNFVLGEEGLVNTVTGTSVSTADFSGDIVIDNGGLITGSWQLVDVDSFGDATFGASVTLRLLGESAEFVAVGDGLYQFGGWSFNSYTGMLTGTGMIPEPSTFAALAGLGAIGLAAMRRRRA